MSAGPSRSDELTLRERFTEIPWDQPLRMVVTDGEGTSYYAHACRYCIAMFGIKGSDIKAGTGYAFQTRDECLDHIDRVHHD